MMCAQSQSIVEELQPENAAAVREAAKKLKNE
jgi:hypothetical protein